MRKYLSISVAVALAFCMPVIPARAQNGPLYCNQVASVFPTTVTTTRVIQAAATGSARILICGYSMQGTGGSVQLVYGTGGTCGTGQNALSPIFLAAVIGQEHAFIWRGLLAPNGNDVCVVTGATVTASQIFVYYTYG